MLIPGQMIQGHAQPWNTCGAGYMAPLHIGLWGPRRWLQRFGAELGLGPMQPMPPAVHQATRVALLQSVQGLASCWKCNLETTLLREDIGTGGTGLGARIGGARVWQQRLCLNVSPWPDLRRTEQSLEHQRGESAVLNSGSARRTLSPRAPPLVCKANEYTVVTTQRT